MHELFKRRDACNFHFMSFEINEFRSLLLTLSVEDLNRESQTVVRAYVADDDVHVFRLQRLDLMRLLLLFPSSSLSLLIVVTPEL